MNTIALVLIALTAITGAIVLFDKLFLAKKREKKSEEAGEEADLPFIVETGYSFFPVLLIVLVVRSFIFEPFRIPSESMLPSLEVGDFIVVNKMSYGLRSPISNKVFLDLGVPERGDVAVFQFPRDKSVDFIKRIVALPGDKVAYRNKIVYINDVAQAQTPSAEQKQFDGFSRFTESLGDIEHDLLEDGSTRVHGYALKSLYTTGVEVPEGHYLALGDNRDRSADSRSWGFVPDENLRGRAVLIWMNFNWNDFKADFRRIGKLID